MSSHTPGDGPYFQFSSGEFGVLAELSVGDLVTLGQPLDDTPTLSDHDLIRAMIPLAIGNGDDFSPAAAAALDDAEIERFAVAYWSHADLRDSIADSDTPTDSNAPAIMIIQLAAAIRHKVKTLTSIVKPIA